MRHQSRMTIHFILKIIILSLYSIYVQFIGDGPQWRPGSPEAEIGMFVLETIARYAARIFRRASRSRRFAGNRLDELRDQGGRNRDRRGDGRLCLETAQARFGIGAYGDGFVAPSWSGARSCSTSRRVKRIERPICFPLIFCRFRRDRNLWTPSCVILATFHD